MLNGVRYLRAPMTKMNTLYYQDFSMILAGRMAQVFYQPTTRAG